MDHRNLHASSVVFDGTVVAKWNRATFERMRAGGLTAVNCTICVWEGIKDTLLNIAQFHRYFGEYADLIMPCRTVADIEEAKRTGRVGIVLGWQNTSGIEDRIELLPLYKELGVGFIQLTYNTQNYVASGCWEKQDGGLSAFGERLVLEMNRTGIVVDLSHVGARSISDAIAISRKPCVFTHVCPAGLFPHPRNKTDAQLKELVKRGGFIGIATYTPFLRRGAESTLEDVIEVFEYVINVCGEQQVGIGTDFTDGQDEAFFDWVRQDKGHGARMVPTRGTAPPVKNFDSLADYPGLTEAMHRRGWAEKRIRRILGENWVRFLGEVW
jgi:membrane dipeptidase